MLKNQIPASFYRSRSVDQENLICRLGKFACLPDGLRRCNHVFMITPDENQVTDLARVDYRNDRRVFGIRRADRRSHMYIVGKTGTGKSTLLANLIRQDVLNGEGVAVVDPHGDLIVQALATVPPERQADVIYFNVPDASMPYRFNPLRNVAPQERSLVASDLLDVFKKIWLEFWGPRLEHILRNALLALLDQPDSSLTDILRLLNDREYRREITIRLPNRAVREFWLREYEEYPARFRAEAIAPIQNKIGAFLSNPILCQILTDSENTIDLRRIIDDRKILLVNLSKGQIGEDTAALLGAFLVAHLGRTALRRADTSEEKRPDFYLYLDEFQTFSTPSLAGMLSELRKYRLNLILAHQFICQLDLTVREAILGNVGTSIVFRVGVTDGIILEKALLPEFALPDLINLPNHHIYLRLMIAGVISSPFSAVTLSNQPQ